MLALDSLVIRGLVEREVLFHHHIFPDRDSMNLDGKLRGTSAQCLTWLARALSTVDGGERTFAYLKEDWSDQGFPEEYTLEHVTYTLTVKGYDVALKIQEHVDQAERFQSQLAISTAQKALSTTANATGRKLAGIATTSSVTAKRALWAAGFIALGSVGNLILSTFSSTSADQLLAAATEV